MDKNTELQIKIFIGQELEKGTNLSDIQNMVNEKFSQKMTYMDIRILASTLDVDWRSLDPNAKLETPADEETSSEVPAEENADIPDETEKTQATDTVVDVNPIARPGMMFSGTVKFASGSTADWYVDNMGRLGVENLSGEKPGKEDIEKFQIELDKALRKMMGR
ncbi:MAG: hypothetical protein J6W00_06045 [Lentisphaeria bacterium]|nr:hypothetical protein [Lentisphaeria bacterium]